MCSGCSFTLQWGFWGLLTQTFDKGSKFWAGRRYHLTRSSIPKTIWGTLVLWACCWTCINVSPAKGEFTAPLRPTELQFLYSSDLNTYFVFFLCFSSCKSTLKMTLSSTHPRAIKYHFSFTAKWRVLLIWSENSFKIKFITKNTDASL